MARRKNYSVEAFKAKLALIPKVAREEVKKELREQAIELGIAIKNAAPVDDGALQNSVRFEVQELRAFVRAGGEATTRPVRQGASASYDYSIGIEHGNLQMAAQPFFWPTYRARKKRIRAGINAAMKRAVIKAGGK